MGITVRSRYVSSRCHQVAKVVDSVGPYPFRILEEGESTPSRRLTFWLFTCSPPTRIVSRERKVSMCESTRVLKKAAVKNWMVTIFSFITA